MKKIAPNLKEVYISGGEPLLIKPLWDFLGFCHEKKYSNQITLHFNTNLMGLKNQHLETLKHFKKVQLGPSIDGIGEIYNSLRYPAKWENIEPHLKEVMGLSNPFEVYLNFTVSLYNVNHIPDFFRYIRSFKKVYINLDLLHEPKHLKIQVLPDSLKKRISKELIEFLESDFNFFEGEKRQLAGVIELLKLDQDDSIELFKQFNQQMDQLRNENSSSVFPHLREIL